MILKNIRSVQYFIHLKKQSDYYEDVTKKIKIILIFIFFMKHVIHAWLKA